MSDRLSMTLLICLTLIGVVALAGMVILEMNGKPILGGLPAIAGAAVVALAGLVTTWGQSIRPVLARVEAVRQELAANTAKTVEVKDLVNDGTAELRQQLAEALAKIEALQREARRVAEVVRGEHRSSGPPPQDMPGG